MKKIILLIFFALPLLVISLEARAQYSWTVTHPSVNADSSHYYGFTALSCSGDNCMAAGLRIDPGKIFLMFWRSTDGGTTWLEQDPGLPYQTGEDQNKFSTIQQIDSLNVVAIADSGLILRTFDGGITWEKQNCNTTHTLWDVHFSDPLTGIVVSTGPFPIHTTTDGGKHWVDAQFADNITDITYFVNCHSYGGGKFRAFRKIFGSIYTTLDNWKTIDSTIPLGDTSIDPNALCFSYDYINFSGGDTIIVYGLWDYNCSIPIALIRRSTDAGKTWAKPAAYYGPIGTLVAMTSIDRDTMLAGGNGLADYLLSTDRGITWNNEDVTLSNTQYQPNFCRNVVWTNNGHPLALYKGFGTIQLGIPAIIIRGDRITNHVEMYENIVWNTHIYPNPATTEIHIVTSDASKQIHLVDILGRNVLQGITSDQGKATLDISHLQRGIYDILLDHYGRMLPVGKVAVLGK